MRLAINTTNQLLPFLLLLLLTLRVSNQWLSSLQSPSLLDPLSPFPQLTFKTLSPIPFIWLVMYLIPLLSQLYPVCLIPLGLWILLVATTWHLSHPYFSQLELAPHPLNIRTANGSTMFACNIGFISTSNLLGHGVFNVPNLSYNLFSMGQLVELGYHISFNYSGCIVHDLRMG